MGSVERLRAITIRAQELSRRGYTVSDVAVALGIGRETAAQMIVAGAPSMTMLKRAAAEDARAHHATIVKAVERWEKAVVRDDNREFRNADNALGLILSRTGPYQVNCHVYRYDAGSDAVVRSPASQRYLAG